MNCKPGDLAVTHGMTVTPEANGYLVEVLHWILPGERYGSAPSDWLDSDGGGWLVRSGIDIPVRIPRTYELKWSKTRVVADECLRPLRNPGEDAKDETLTWKPVPHWSDALIENARKVAEDMERLS